VRPSLPSSGVLRRASGYFTTPAPGCVIMHAITRKRGHGRPRHPQPIRPIGVQTKDTTHKNHARSAHRASRAKSQQQQQSRKLQTRAKIILGAAFVRFVDGLAADRQQKAVQSLWALVSERDRQALLDSGLLPEQAIHGDSTDSVKIPPSASDAEKSGDCA
jgi:hypothetical protein